MAPDKLLDYWLENLKGTVLVERWGRKGFSITQYHKLKWLYCSPKENGQRNQRNRNEIWLQGTYRI